MSVRQGTEVRAVGKRIVTVRERQSIARVLAIGGIVGPLLFTAVFIVQGFFRPGYSHLSDPVSALAAGPHGWVQNVNFFVFGPLMVAYAVALHLGLRSARSGSFGTALLVLSGVGLVVAGAFPGTRDASGAFSVGPGHITGAFMAFLGAGAGLIVVSRRMARDPRWRGFAAYAFASGITIVVLFLATGRLAAPDDAPLHEWAGLMQRLTLAVWFPCTIVLAVKLRRLATTAEREEVAIPAGTR